MTAMEQQIDFDETESWNAEDAAELDRPTKLSDYNVSIAGRDWTVETMVQQIRQGNIDLDPAFQRRNAWRDHRRSRLIESFILGFPVPQIVLAENPRRKKTFIVIDGKQRLLTIAGLYLKEYRGYWAKSKLSGLNVLKELNGVKLDELLSDNDYLSEQTRLGNADIRTTMITGFQDEGVLYDIFYRINTGSVPLSSQELRQVLNRGEFAKFLLEVTSDPNPLWPVLRIDAPDSRLRDVELLLRLIAWRKYATHYVGNMKPFLDDTMKKLNASWKVESEDTIELVSEVLRGAQALEDIFETEAGRKYKNKRFEPSLNRALFEVQAYYFSLPKIRTAGLKKRRLLVDAFKELSEKTEFNDSIESTTKSIENYRSRFDLYRSMLQKTLRVAAPPLAVGQRDDR